MEVLSRDEVYVTGKENIEGLASLISYYLKRILASTSNPALINIDNDEDFDEEKILRGQLFY